MGEEREEEGNFPSWLSLSLSLSSSSEILLSFSPLGILWSGGREGERGAKQQQHFSLSLFHPPFPFFSFFFQSRLRCFSMRHFIPFSILFLLPKNIFPAATFPSFPSFSRSSYSVMER